MSTALVPVDKIAAARVNRRWLGPRTAEEMQAVIRERSIVTDDGCWLWQGRVNGAGYGVLDWVAEGSVPVWGVHRVSYWAHVGPIPPGLQIDHLCRTKLCGNPRHLDPVTPAENSRRANWKSHCVHGHPYDDVNTFWQLGPGRPQRRCRSCSRLVQARYRARQNATVAAA